MIILIEFVKLSLSLPLIKCEPLLGIFVLKKSHEINSQRYFCRLF